MECCFKTKITWILIFKFICLTELFYISCAYCTIFMINPHIIPKAFLYVYIYVISIIFFLFYHFHLWNTWLRITLLSHLGFGPIQIWYQYFIIISKISKFFNTIYGIWLALTFDWYLWYYWEGLIIYKWHWELK